MERYRPPGPLIVAIMASYGAYEVVDALIREFSESITYGDLVVIFVLGLIAGIALGLVLARQFCCWMTLSQRAERARNPSTSALRASILAVV